jgi:cytochrome c-type biogenesis protein CcmF
MITDLGYVALVLALLLAIYGIVVSVVGALRRLPELVASGRNAIYAVGALVLLASLLLWRALLTNEFQVEYVASHSERALPALFKFSAHWGGQEGSLLFWTLIACGFSVAATWFFRRQAPSMKPWVHAVLLTNVAFFLIVVLFAANPFLRYWRDAAGEIITSVFAPANGQAIIPRDGQGLNPQLQNYWMVIHPVFLYLGFVGMTVPFAFAVAALVTGQLGNTWIKMVRKWTLVPWLFLGIGILLGSQWAYVELGWGGYWAWDAVENASFLPWLTATAFIHSIMIQERRGMLKVWNMVLIWLTWELTLIGTFITRSGVIQSVHSFALSPVGPLFAAFIVLTMIGFVLLLAWRLPLLKSENQLDAVLSRETAFLTQNVLFLVITAAVLLGTIFPMISEWVTGDKISLNAPYFNRVAGPLMLALLLLMGAAPLLAWRRSAFETLRKNFLVPILAAVASIPVLFLLGNRNMGGFVGVAAMTFVFAGILQEYVRGVRARRQATGEPIGKAFASLVRRNGRRYGGYVVHIGVLLICLGIIGNTFYQEEGQANLRAGESITVANYTLTYNKMDAVQGPNYTEFAAVLDLAKNGQPTGQIVAKKNIYDKNAEQPMTEVGLRTGPIEDVYVVLAGFANMGETAAFKVYVNPLMSWMWIGGLVMILGVLISAWPRRSHAAAEARARVPEGAQPAA